MHMLSNFIGAVGNLMVETGIQEISSSVFAGVSKMLMGKKFPMCLRALRMVVEAILAPIIKFANGYDDLLQILEERALQSRTCKLWLDCLVKPMFIMMAYVRAEREGDWALHVESVKAMIPYFFVAGHNNYARSGTVYLRTIEKLPDDVLVHFLNGEHVMRHVPGLWNGIWSDMFIESTFMRYGHGKAGIVGITLKPETLKTWALSRHICSRLVDNMNSLQKETKDQCQVTHKEEGKSRVQCDQKDRDGIKQKISMCINPLDPSVHPDPIVNVANGAIAPPAVNVDRALSIGITQVTEFQQNLPQSFNKSISKKVTTMAATKKGTSIGLKVLYDTRLIYSCVIALQASNRDADIKDIL